MTRRIAYLAPVALLLAATSATAQFPDSLDSKPQRIPSAFSEVAEVTATIVPAKAKRGETVTFQITISPKPGAWTYPARPKDPGQASKNRFALPEKPGEVIFVTPVTDPARPQPKTKPRDEGKPAGPKDEYYPDRVSWEFTAVVSPTAKPGKTTVGLDPELTQIQACTKDTCLFAKTIPTALLEILDGEVPIDAAFQTAVTRAMNPGAPPAPGPASGSTNTIPGTPGTERSKHSSPKKTAKPIEDYRADLEDVRRQLDVSEAAPPVQGIGGFVLTAMIWGLVSLVTPCVFPMIPITISIFLKHAHGSLRERLKLAGVYCLTIIAVLGVSAFALLKFMAWLSTNPITNVLLGGLFVVLALSLFGMYELTLPSFMSRRLQAKQAKGGVVGTIFGALAFTVISFTCVAPFLGGFAGISAADSAGGNLISVPTWKEIAGGFAFATAFAAPFFVLALVPGLLKALPKSGGWLDSVKVVMGFLEIAAALKFFRTAELRSPFGMAYFTYDLVLAGWVAISFACGLYLLNAYRLPHDEEKPNIGVVRLLFALLFLGLGFYLLPGTFKGADGVVQRPKGAVFAWVDAFLLPEPKAPARSGGKESEKELVWRTDLKDALDRVRNAANRNEKPRPIFIDFTGKTCSNCRLNEENVLPLPEVQDLLREFERVQLYTDEVPAELYATDPGYRARVREATANNDFKSDPAVFGTGQLPLYVILIPQESGKVKAVVYPEGAINRPGEFIAFLKDGLERAKK